LFVSFVIDLKPAKLTLLSAENFPFAQKFTVLGFLLFKSLFGGYYFRKEIFQKWSGLIILGKGDSNASESTLMA